MQIIYSIGGETETFESYNIRDDVMSLMNEANIRPYGGYRVKATPYH